MKKTIEERLLNIEKNICNNEYVPGTILQRSLSDKGLNWTLAIGRMQESKKMFEGKTIEQAINKAEKFYK
jgi:hypothetical protein